MAWSPSLQRDYALDLNSARALYDYVKSQVDALGAISSDETIIVETFFDAVGEARVVVHSPFGGRINGAWSLALVDALKERTGIEIESMVSDDGILLRLPGVVLGAQDQGALAAGVPQEAAFAGADLSVAADVVGGMSAARGPAAHPARAAELGRLRRALPRQRRPRAAAAALARPQAHPLLASADEGARPARHRPQRARLPDHGRDLSRLPPRRDGPGAPGRRC